MIRQFEFLRTTIHMSSVCVRVVCVHVCVCVCVCMLCVCACVCVCVCLQMHYMCTENDLKIDSPSKNMLHVYGTLHIGTCTSSHG